MTTLYGDSFISLTYPRMKPIRLQYQQELQKLKTTKYYTDNSQANIYINEKKNDKNVK